MLNAHVHVHALDDPSSMSDIYSLFLYAIFVCVCGYVPLSFAADTVAEYTDTFRPACHSTLFQAWETFLQEIEADSAASADVATSLSRQVNKSQSICIALHTFLHITLEIQC